MQPGWMSRATEEDVNDFLGLHLDWFLRIRDRLPARRTLKAKEALWLLRWLDLDKHTLGSPKAAKSELILNTLARVWELPWFLPFTTTPEANALVAEHCARNGLDEFVIVRLSSSVPGQLVTSEMKNGVVVHMRFESVGSATLYAQQSAAARSPPKNTASYGIQHFDNAADPLGA